MAKDNLFSGRMMKCQKCGWEFKSDAKRESMWTTVEIDGRLLDYCPYCWGVPSYHIPLYVREARKSFDFIRGLKND